MALASHTGWGNRKVKKSSEKTRAAASSCAEAC